MAKKIIMEQHLAALSYKDGDGVVAQIRRDMHEDIRCLFVGFGGTGLDALEKVIHDLRQILPADHFRDQIAALAVDTAKDAFYRDVEVEIDGVKTMEQKPRFDEVKEQCLLPYSEAKEWQNNPHLLPSGISAWLNPDVLSHAVFNGNGANRIRQVGRILLSQPAALSLLKEKVFHQIHHLMDGATTTTKLKVFFFYGIAGGTGSGCIIDGTYLVRHFISALGISAQYCGYLYLPAVSSNVEDSHRANAYAALKEVDHFMTLEKRGERHVHNFGTVTVNTDKNLFDICVLMEGKTNGILSSEADNRAKAFGATSDSILDNITALPAKSAAGAAIHSIDEYLDNNLTAVMNMVKTLPEKSAPRDANYSYAMLGFARAVVPIGLLKAHIMHMVFKKMKQQYDNCTKPNAEVATAFLKTCKVLGGGLFPCTDQAEMMTLIKKELKDTFLDPDFGPAYVCNLTKEAIDVLPDKIGGSAARQQAQRYVLDQLRQMNNKIFNTYFKVIQEMSKYLEEATGILTSVTLRQSYNNSSFSWLLLDMDPADAQMSAFVGQFLKAMVPDSKLSDLVSDFLQEMYDNTAAWTQTEVNDINAEPAFCAHKRLRIFIEEKIGAIVTGSLEDYLVKLYTNNIHAQSVRPGDPLIAGSAEDIALTKAAQAIINDMLNTGRKAAPLVEYHDSGMIPDNRFVSRAVMFVPEKAPNLLAKIKTLLPANVTLFEGTASDCISCYWRYDGLPAHQLLWAMEGEAAYENSIRSYAVGLHMSETAGGKQWRNYPNMTNRDLWDVANPGYTAPREVAIADRAKAAMTEADRLGAVDTALISGTAVYECFLHMLDEAYLPDVALIQAVDAQVEGTPAHTLAQNALQTRVNELAAVLYEKLNLGNTTLNTPNGTKELEVLEKVAMVTALRKALGTGVTTRKLGTALEVLTPDPNEPIPENWTMDLAAKLLRTKVDLLFALRGQVMVLDALAGLIEANNTRVAAEEAAKLDLENFLKLCSMERSADDKDFVITYREFTEQDEDGEEEKFLQWIYLDANKREKVLVNLKSSNSTQCSFKHFFAFRAYQALAAEVKTGLLEYLEDRKSSVCDRAHTYMEALIQVLDKVNVAKSAVEAPEGWADSVTDPKRFLYCLKVFPGNANFETKVGDPELAQAILDFYTSAGDADKLNTDF